MEDGRAKVILGNNERDNSRLRRFKNMFTIGINPLFKIALKRNSERIKVIKHRR